MYTARLNLSCKFIPIWALNTVSTGAIERQHQPQNPLTHARAQQEYCEVCPSVAASVQKITWRMHNLCALTPPHPALSAEGKEC